MAEMNIKYSSLVGYAAIIATLALSSGVHAQEHRRHAHPIRHVLRSIRRARIVESIPAPPPAEVVVVQRERPIRVQAVAPRPLVNLDALSLLRRKLMPLADYAGDQITEVRNGRSSKQHVVGDTRGRIRVDYVAPNSLAGDILIIGPESYRNYHHATNTLDVAVWPTAWNDRDKRLIAAVQQGRVTARKTGEEIIAGRVADIIEVTPNRAVLNGAGQARYWVDRDTGIQLKNEIWNAAGFVSRTYLINIVIGPQAGVIQNDFQPPVFRSARINPMFPRQTPQYQSVAEAASQLPFAPMEPSQLPPGFHISGVWVFKRSGNRPVERTSILMRYTDNVTYFSLFERVLPPDAPPPRTPRNARLGIERWRYERPGGILQVTYVGQLGQEEVQAVQAGLR
jgi:hypothetical protein